VADAFQGGVTSESLESIVSVLIGVNTQSGGLNDYLRELKKEAGFTQYVSIGKATAKELAKLGGFVSKSISSQSQALGSGSAGQSLSF
jgi:uroporphyrinogen-III synthase